MKIWVRAGSGFHAGDELEHWLRQAFEPDHVAAVIGCLYQILDIRTQGFATNREKWRRQGFGEVWTFHTLSFRIAARIPGDGRYDTSDICLLASERTSGDRDPALKAFQDVIRWRMANGREIEWDI